MTNVLRDILNACTRDAPENVHQRLSEIRDAATVWAGVGQVGVIAGIFASVIGIVAVATVTSPVAVIPAYLILGTGLAISYLSWNTSALATNVAALARKPLKYLTLGVGDRFDTTLLRERLRRNTLACDLCIDLFMNMARWDQVVD